MTDLYLIRHGETEWSKSGRHTSVTDLPLTDAGLEQADRLRGKLDRCEFGLILSSPRSRALQTAERAGFIGDTAPTIDPDLAEWDYGDYEGLTSDQIEQKRPDWQLWIDGCPGGETPDQVIDRLNRVIVRVRGSDADRAICFAHGHALRVLSLCWLGLELSHGEQFPLKTTSISVLGMAKGQPALQRWNTRP
jgi:probable phosphoglycerate mutase